jgi:AcrR family transcriptional regulator
MERQPDTRLPASIEAAWGRRERPSRGPKPTLSLEQIVHAAIGIARADGLAAVSMARVAQELGAATMSLYRYVAAKDELIALMVDAALGPPTRGDPGESWRDGLARWAWDFHERLRQHPWSLRVPIGGLPTTPNLVAWLEDALWSLRDTGLSEDAKASVVLLLSGYVRSEGTLTADLVAAGAISDEVMSGYSRLMAALADPERFPALHKLLAAGVFEAADDPDKEFAFGLERILDGVAALI